MTINKITEEQYPDLWDYILDFSVAEDYHEHRRGSNYYTSHILKFDPDNCPEHPELHGLWQTEAFIHDYEHGGDGPDEAYRVERKARMVEETFYELVKDHVSA